MEQIVLGHGPKLPPWTGRAQVGNGSTPGSVDAAARTPAQADPVTLWALPVARRSAGAGRAMGWLLCAGSLR